MIKSYVSKLLKDSFYTNFEERKKQIDLKQKELMKSPKLNRTISEHNANLLLSNRDKTSVMSKERFNQAKVKDFSSLKKEFNSAKPLKINSIKSAKNLGVEKAPEKLKIKPAPAIIKVAVTKPKKENIIGKYERNSSYSSLNDKLVSPKNLKKGFLSRSKSNDFRSVPSKDLDKFKQYKKNDAKTIIEVKESKILKSNKDDNKFGLKRNYTGRMFSNLTTRNDNGGGLDLKRNMKTNYTTTNIFSKLYQTTNDKAVQRRNFMSAKKPVEKSLKPLKKPKKHMLTYAFSNPPPKTQKPRPKTEFKKIPMEAKRIDTKPKTTLDKALPVTKRPLTSYKKYETEFRMNETSLSTQASSLFKGRVEDYAIGKEIGKGAYAIVKQALHKPTNMKVAVKIYEKSKLIDPQRNSSVKKEIQILQKIDHSNIVKLHEVIATTKQILLVMELVNGVSLLSFLKSKENRRLEIPECKEVCYQVVNALTHLHEKKIVHRDIKLENILIDEGKKVKILDFGFGCITANKKLDFFCGTPSYMPPEIVQKKDYIGEYADVWSLGILYYTLLCGAFPFKAQNEKDLYAKIIKGVFLFPDHVPNSACILLRKILHLTPSLRPSADEISNDAWFNTVRMADASKLYQSLELTTSNTVPKLLNEA